MQTEMISSGELSRLLNIPRYQLEYKIASGYLPEPEFRFLGKRAFNSEEVTRIAKYFGKEIDSVSI